MLAARIYLLRAFSDEKYHDNYSIVPNLCTYVRSALGVTQITEEGVNGSMGREMQRQLRALQSQATSLAVTVQVPASGLDPPSSRSPAPRVAVRTAGQG
jgi:hypothetical protein